MSTNQETIRGMYLREAAVLARRKSPKTVHMLRDTGVRAVRDMPIPHVGLEAWRQTNVAPMVNTFHSTLLEPPENKIPWEILRSHFPLIHMPNRMVFMNGFYREDLSCLDALHGRAYAGGFTQTLSGNNGSWMETLLGDSPRPHHFFAAVNSAFLQDGAVIYVPQNVAIEGAIHIVFLTGERPENTATHVHNLFILGANSRAHIVVHHKALPGAAKYMNTCVEDIRLGENASLRRAEVTMDSESGYRVALCHVRQERDSRLHSTALGMECGAITRNETHVALTGANTETRLNGLGLTRGRCLLDNEVFVDHQAPHCLSRMFYRNVLFDASHCVFTGKVHVAREAQQTDSEQMCASLALSEHVRVDAKPQLEIYADDVRCTHGTTVGGHVDNEVYYLRSRGISKSKACYMLTRGFVDEVLDTVHDSGTRDWLSVGLSERLRSES